MKQGYGKKALAGVAVLGLVAGGLFGGVVGYVGHGDPMPIQIIKEVPVEVIKEVNVTKEVLKEVNVSVEVPVDNGNLDLVAQRLEDLGFYEDADEVVLEIQAEDVAIALAVEEIKDEGLDFLEDEGLYIDEDDLRIVRVREDFEDIEVLESDFDDNEYEFRISAKIDDDTTDTKQWVHFNVSVEDDKAELESVAFEG